MKKGFRLKWWLSFTGGGLGLAGAIFVAVRLYANAGQIDLGCFNGANWFIFALLAAVYGISNLLLASAWWYVLNYLAVKSTWFGAAKIYGQSQIAKYVPGNIFHLAGRQALGMAAELPPWALAKSTLWELGMIAVAGVIWGIFTAPLLWPFLSVWLSSMLFVAVLALLLACAYHRFSPSIAAALTCQSIFLALSGVVFIGILRVVVPAQTLLPPFVVLGGAYVLAWLVGFVTPGAPAGLGVREMVLLFLLGGQIQQADLVLAVVLGRLVNIVGDFIYFVMATFIDKKGRIAECERQ